MDGLQENPSGHRAQERQPFLNLLPVELKSNILMSIHSFPDLLALTTASKPYHMVAQRENSFTNTALQELESRGVSILPRDIITPRSLNYSSLIARVPGTSKKNCRKRDIGKALKAYLTQYQVGGAVRLSVRQCHALLSLLDVVTWDYSFNTEPGELAKKAIDPRESISLLTEQANTGGLGGWFVRIHKVGKYRVAGESGHLHSFDGIDGDPNHLVVGVCGWPE